MGIVEGPFQNVTSLFTGSQDSDVQASIYGGDGLGSTASIPSYNFKLGSVVFYLTTFNGLEWANPLSTSAKQSIADSFTASTTPTNGFNDLYSSSSIHIVRDSATVVIVTIPYLFDYDESLAESIAIECPVDAFSVQPDDPVTCSPSLSVTNDFSIPTGSIIRDVRAIAVFAAFYERFNHLDLTLSDADLQAYRDGNGGATAANAISGIVTIPAAGFKYDVGATTDTANGFSFNINTRLSTEGGSRLIIAVHCGLAYGSNNIPLGATFWADRGLADTDDFYYKIINPL